MKLELTPRQAKTVLMILDRELRDSEPIDAYGMAHIKRVRSVAKRLNDLTGRKLILHK